MSDVSRIKNETQPLNETHTLGEETAANLRAGIYDPPRSSRGDAARAQALDEPQDKPKDKPEDKPRTIEEIQREAKEAQKRLLKESANGEWTDDSKKTWHTIFEGVVARPGMTKDELAETLTRISADVSGQLKKEGSKNRVGVAFQEDGDKKETTYYMQLLGPDISAAKNAATMMKHEESPTVIKAGILKLKQ
jgi:hypothetical protein